jgi:hypothetical protein
MNTGLTIAFICDGNNHPSVINYAKFGNQYWDDTKTNKSQVGYYFAYYYQQKHVYIHKIINILQPHERPPSMEWDSNRQILCLSEQIKQFTWSEWIHGIGVGSPYTPTYRMTQTGSWSFNQLQKKYHIFNFGQFINIIEQLRLPQPSLRLPQQSPGLPQPSLRLQQPSLRLPLHEEVLLMQEFEKERKAMLLKQEEKLKEFREKKIITLRHEAKSAIMKKIDALQEEMIRIDNGDMDEQLINNST